jgi:DNA-binding NtrC family response regulator
MEPDPQLTAVTRALRIEHGNVTAAAQRLGMHRTQLRRLLQRQQIDPKRPPRS